MSTNKLDHKVKNLMDLGYNALISRNSKDITNFKSQIQLFQQFLKNASNNTRQQLHFNCPECNNPMQRNISLTTHKIYWFCKCYGHSFDTLELIHKINRKKRRQNKNGENKKR